MGHTPIVIVAPTGDIHATTVRKRVHEYGYACEVYDLRNMPSTGVTGTITPAQAPYLQTGNEIIDRATVVWWRRAYLPSIENITSWDREVKNFVDAEWKYGLQGLLFATGCQIVNDPFCEHSASFKPLQLAAARRVGLAIPETCVTNDVRIATDFIKRLNNQGRRCVCKPLTAPRREMAETRVIGVEELNPEALALAPVIFQECVEKGTDIRVSIFGDESFAAKVITRHEELVDWRLDPLVSYHRYEIPDELRSHLLLLLREMKLDMGSIDLRLDREGQPVFFEINPSGQFLFLEVDADLPVSRSVAKFLIGKHLAWLEHDGSTAQHI